MSIYQRPLRSDELMHWEWEKKNHKYIDKIRTASGGWRYIYDIKDELSGKNARKNLYRKEIDYKNAKRNTQRVLRDNNSRNDLHPNQEWDRQWAAMQKERAAREAYNEALRKRDRNPGVVISNVTHKVKNIATKRPTFSHITSGKKTFSSLLERLKNRKPRRSRITVSHDVSLGRGQRRNTVKL